MSSYTGTAGRPDRAKAIAAVVAVHAALAFVILSGLNVRTVSEAVDALKTFNLAQPPPPPPVPPPPPKPRPQPEMKKAAGAPAKRAEPAPIVAPAPKIPVPSPLPAAKVAGTGTASSSGAAAAGSGTGAGGAGNGPGGGGYADYSRFTPAKLLTPLRNRDYQALTANRMPSGSGDVAIVIAPSGHISNCRLIRSSGDPYVDAGLCPLVASRLYFSPARDDQGRPISYSTNFHAQWSLRG
jgi:protein TonB